MRIALFQPDIPQNAGAVLRLGACLGIAVDVIEPCGFAWSDSRMRRAGMDYREKAVLTRHVGWDAFTNALPGRLILATTRASVPFLKFSFAGTDTLLFGRESSGVPDWVHAAADGRVLIPMRAGLRSLNLAQSVAMIAGEALRQVDGFPNPGLDAAGQDIEAKMES